MKRFAIIENQTVTNIAIATSPLEANWIDLTGISTEPGTGWAYTGGVFTAPVVPPAVVPPPSRILTRTQFRKRFTQTEREDADELEETFKSNAALTAAQKRKLRSGYKDFNSATVVDLDDSSITPMFDLYIALGILTQARAAEILA